MVAGRRYPCYYPIYCLDGYIDGLITSCSGCTARTATTFDRWDGCFRQEINQGTPAPGEPPWESYDFYDFCKYVAVTGGSPDYNPTVVDDIEPNLIQLDRSGPDGTWRIRVECKDGASGTMLYDAHQRTLIGASEPEGWYTQTDGCADPGDLLLLKKSGLACPCRATPFDSCPYTTDEWDTFAQGGANPYTQFSYAYKIKNYINTDFGVCSNAKSEPTNPSSDWDATLYATYPTVITCAWYTDGDPDSLGNKMIVGRDSVNDPVPIFEGWLLRSRFDGWVVWWTVPLITPGGSAGTMHMYEKLIDEETVEGEYHRVDPTLFQYYHAILNCNPLCSDGTGPDTIEIVAV